MRYVILMLAASLLNGQYFNAKFVPTVNPPKGYYIDLSITFKSDGTVILKKKTPCHCQEVKLSGKDCADMVRNSRANLTAKALQPVLSDDRTRLTFYQSKSTVTYTKKK
ncbi:hypothetical protein FOL47_005489 [Perkinsus chesapeaki]|uniref:Uncharacterized protein n=1 Tax=Perkinsus chesapeaki TaxID=330153 RepID=A0A7J6LXG6_PERCH|nr:hypothetical protein FOL47_005489 [Perkinsus chesapeaki]